MKRSFYLKIIFTMIFKLASEGQGFMNRRHLRFFAENSEQKFTVKRIQ